MTVHSPNPHTPLQSTLWDAQCRPVFDFGSGPFSMVRWNPFSRFIAMMGFGNLPGAWGGVGWGGVR